VFRRLFYDLQQKRKVRCRRLPSWPPKDTTQGKKEDFHPSSPDDAVSWRKKKKKKKVAALLY